LLASEVRVYVMPAENLLIADNLAALAQGAKSVRLRDVPNKNPYVDAMLVGGGLSYAALQLHFEYNVPPLTKEIGQPYGLTAPADTKLTSDWFSTMCRYSRFELARDATLTQIAQEYKKYISPLSGAEDYYNIGIGFVKFQVSLADAHHRVHAGNSELDALRAEYGDDLTDVFGALDPEAFKDSS
jgi:hypothetical protein